MAAAGHEFFAPTYTGLGERAHLANPRNDLDLHIGDVLGVVRCEDLHNVMLIGHSYGGIVAIVRNRWKEHLKHAEHGGSEDAHREEKRA